MTLPLSASDILKEVFFSALTFPLASGLPSCSSPSRLLPKPVLGKACWVSGFQMPGQEGSSPEVLGRGQKLGTSGFHRHLWFLIEGVRKQLFQTRVFAFCIQKGNNTKRTGGHLGRTTAANALGSGFSGSSSSTGVSIRDTQCFRPSVLFLFIL